MRKIVFFILGVLLAIAILNWVDGYYALPKEERASFLNYIDQDINQKFKQAKTSFKALPDMITMLQQNQKLTSTALLVQLQKALETEYLLSGKYPTDLSKIIANTELENGSKLEYRRTKHGYLLRLIDKDGTVIKEVYHES